MSYIHLLVKGDAEEARLAAYERGVYVDVVRQREVPAEGGRIETIMRADTGCWGRVASWYLETVPPPYPVGTLLFYSFKEQNEGERINA